MVKLNPELPDRLSAKFIRDYRRLFDRLLARELILPETHRAAVSWIPEFEAGRWRSGTRCGWLLGLGDSLERAADAGDGLGVTVGRAALEAFLDILDGPDAAPIGSAHLPNGGSGNEI